MLEYAVDNVFSYYRNKINLRELFETYMCPFYKEAGLASIFKTMYVVGYRNIYSLFTSKIKEYNSKNRKYNIKNYEYLYRNPYNFYTYERNLINLSRINDESYHMPVFHNEIGILVKTISASPIIKEYKEWVQLYNIIIKRYHLCFCDLVRISNIEPYISGKQSISPIHTFHVPVFIDLPKLP